LLGAMLKLKEHSKEMFSRNTALLDHGIASTWRNQSDTVRMSKQMRVKEQQQKSAARRLGHIFPLIIKIRMILQ
jgi:hypothetical protein